MKRDNTESVDEVSTHPKLKGIDKKLVELILSEIMDHGPPIQWDDIAGIFKEALRLILIFISCHFF